MKSLEEQILGALEEYTEEVQEEIESVLEDVAEEAVVQLKQSSPKRTGKYRRGWKLQKTSKNGKTEIVVYNAKYGSLTHLLENGHKARDHTTFVAARPHIAKVEQLVIKEAEKRVERVLKG